MILGGGIAIKTIGEEFASYFGGQGFVHCQTRMSSSNNKRDRNNSWTTWCSSALAGKGVKRLKKLTGYHDAKREEINNAFKKGEITELKKREMLEKLKDDRGNLGQTFRSGWMNNKHKNILTKAWRAKNAYKEGKDLGVIEEAKYLGSKMLFRHNIRGIENKEAKISKNQQKIDKVQKAIDFENYKKEYNLPDFNQKKLDKAENKMIRLNRKEAKIKERIDEKAQREIMSRKIFKKIQIIYTQPFKELKDIKRNLRKLTPIN
ncbi:hypothetical protein [Mesomycoplasma ovipneumoniae]|uniref:hypothetical protein n=1 Tax=Mesomycoplasma ovipneumoniae TaxID=29562 RepID=UPI0028AD242C|nr:hypothetical protein [Mesomycoplasma ovipneumoniae]WNM14985.1 hypothetical protein RNM01_04540 [Mesomycoplasma ovipneumoniae]